MKNLQIQITEDLENKWDDIIESESAPALKTNEDRKRMITILETAEQTLMNEETNTTGMAKWDPVLISMIRRTQPSLMTAQMVGVQPMTGPTGLIFTHRIHYLNTDGTRTETWAQAAPDAARSGSMNTDVAEQLGKQTGAHVNTSDAGAAQDPVTFVTNPWQEMDFTIDSTEVRAKSRALKARFTEELRQDLRTIHGMDAEKELVSILSAEIVAEIDREILALMLSSAVDAGAFDLNTNTDGRWAVEKYKLLAVKIAKEANLIARGTRRGRGNFIVTSGNIVAALSMAGLVDTQTEFGLAALGTNLTYSGVLAGTIKVYIDPYATQDYVLVGYKGATMYDAGVYYCPYVAAEYANPFRTRGEEDMQPRIGFKTRYGLQQNPFAAYDGTAAGAIAALGNGNQYFRKFTVANV